MRWPRCPGSGSSSRTSAFAFKGKQQDVRAIGAQLRVRGALEGSVRRAGRRLRVTTQLDRLPPGLPALVGAVRPGAGRPLRDAGRDLARHRRHAAANSVRRRHRLVRPPTDDLEAYEAYLKGRHFWNRRSEEDLRKGLGPFSRRWRATPTTRWPTPASRIPTASWASIRMWPTEAFPAAKAAALQALELDPRLAEPHPTLAYVAMYHDWDWAEAERAAAHAIDLIPATRPPTSGTETFSRFLIRVRANLVDRIRRKRSPWTPLSPLRGAALGWRDSYFARRYDEGT